MAEDPKCRRRGGDGDSPRHASPSRGCTCQMENREGGSTSDFRELCRVAVLELAVTAFARVTVYILIHGLGKGGVRLRDLAEVMRILKKTWTDSYSVFSPISFAMCTCLGCRKTMSARKSLPSPARKPAA